MEEIFSRTITNTDEKGKKYSFVTCDIFSLIKQHLTIGDKVILPMAMKNKVITFYEMGGRNPDSSMSIATLIAGKNDKIPTALLFNKLSRKPNAKQAFVEMRNKFSIYVGRVSVFNNPLAPNIKIFKLTFNGKNDELSENDTDTTYCNFVVDKVFTKYSEIRDNVPAKRLVAKLFTDNVVRPFYVNGWSYSETCAVSDKKQLVEIYQKLYGSKMKVEEVLEADAFLDIVENDIIKYSVNTKLSAAIQILDFNNDEMMIYSSTGLRLDNINGTLNKLEVQKCTRTCISSMFDAYNTELIFNNVDIDTFRIALQYDNVYSVEIKPGVFGVILAYKG